ncbi:BfmA/BtgA family mobilization protein [Mucilaginibacter sp. E4BP6]|uniref:BfmA/BtgA family mobilization protein n=1 Tax=Mucilaginibacter sp. E4BP6 TaxID=2723089 RepID=UPI0015C9CFCC|nr:BfmA/BtgA family mobilization protein [Mucilaginibacter sp. E4BP6]
MSNDVNVKTIRFPVKTDEKLQSLANKSGLTKLDFFVHMVDYFYKSKKDPRDLNDELLKNAINKKTDNIIAFIRTQEGELLIPLKKESERMIGAQENIINFFNNHVIGFNEDQRKVTQLQSNNINKILELLKKQEEFQNDKKLLKNRFSELLEYYIKNREQMTMLTKQQEKDELNKHVREQLKYL